MTTIEPNEHGVYPKDIAECLVYDHKHAHAEICILETPEGWVSSSSYEHKTGNHSGMLSPLKVSKQFPPLPSRAACLAREVEYLISAQDRHLAGPHDSLFNAAQRDQCSAIIAWALNLNSQPLLL